MPGMPLAHGAARALRVVGAHPPADDPARMDPDDLGTHVRVGRVLAGECLGGAADLEAAHRPWADRDELVDHERGLAVGRDIPELAGVPQVAATNVDHVGLGIGLEPYGAVLQRASGASVARRPRRWDRRYSSSASVNITSAKLTR